MLLVAGDQGASGLVTARPLPQQQPLREDVGGKGWSVLKSKVGPELPAPILDVHKVRFSGA